MAFFIYVEGALIEKRNVYSPRQHSKVPVSVHSGQATFKLRFVSAEEEQGSVKEALLKTAYAVCFDSREPDNAQRLVDLVNDEDELPLSARMVDTLRQRVVALNNDNVAEWETVFNHVLESPAKISECNMLKIQNGMMRLA